MKFNARGKTNKYRTRGAKDLQALFGCVVAWIATISWGLSHDNAAGWVGYSSAVAIAQLVHPLSAKSTTSRKDSTVNLYMYSDLYVTKTTLGFG